jgi:hypothetical protein
LIELLSSFTILVIIIGVLAVTLHTLSDTWQQAQSRTRVVVQARTIMDQIAQDLRQVVISTNFPITISDEPTNSFGAANQAIEFLRHLPPTNHSQYAFAAIRYGVTNSTIQYWRQPLDGSDTNAYPEGWRQADSLPLSQPPVALTEGVAALQFLPPVSATNEMGETIPSGSFLDVYLELLPLEDVRAANALAGTNQTLFVERRVLRFCQRVFLPSANRGGLP